MAMESKVALLNSTRDACAEIMTQAQLDQMMAILAGELSKYEMETIKDAGPESDDCLGAFLTAKSVEGRSQGTLDRYAYIIKRMMASLSVQTRNITVYHLRKYLGDEKARGLSDRSLEGQREVFSAYFNWLHREGLIKANPCANLGAIKCKKEIKQAYKDTEVERLKAVCESPRDKAIISFMRASGCRVSEIVRLNRDSIDLTRRECKVVGKGDKERIVYIDTVTAMIIQDYLTSRTDKSEALFPGRGTDRMSAQGMRALLKRLQSDAHLETNVHPHKFRRTLATGLIHRGMPIQEVAAILGHDKLDTTMQYVVIDRDDVKHSYERYYS